VSVCSVVVLVVVVVVVVVVGKNSICGVGKKCRNSRIYERHNGKY
jgi:hypothetical protein